MSFDSQAEFNFYFIHDNKIDAPVKREKDHLCLFERKIEISLVKSNSWDFPPAGRRV